MSKKSAKYKYALILAHVFYCVLAFLIYRKAGMPTTLFVLTVVMSLGFYVRHLRLLVMVVLIATCLVFLFYFSVSKYIGYANPLNYIPDLIAMALDTNRSEVSTAISNLGGKYEYFSLGLLACCVYIFIRAKRHLLASRVLYVVTPAASVSMLVLLGAGDFIFSKTYAGLHTAYEVYDENAESISRKQAFRWNAVSGYAGKDTVLVVLGETARGDRFGINGYQRDTTPLLSSIKELISYRDAVSNAAYTLLSTPIILTRSMGETNSRIYHETSLISAFKEAGYITHYVSYLGKLHKGDSAINQIVLEADHYHEVSKKDERRLDQDGQKLVEELIDTADEKKLIIFKMIGSHFNFQDRYDEQFNVFRPSYTDIKYSNPGKEDKAILDNTYDNTILKTDHVLHGIIQKLKATEGRASFAFISDHGSAIFEDGRSLYGGATRYNYDIPLLFWLKPGHFDSDKHRYLQENSTTPVDSTCFLDTIFSISDISTPRKKGCDLSTGKIDKYQRMVIVGNEFVDYDQYFSRRNK